MEDALDMLGRILLALVLGGAVGLERELRERAAGFRTHILVAVGAAAFTLSSIYGFEGVLSDGIAADYQFDPARVAAQIVSGIGFLGAGAIIRHGVSVRGLTTAASLWAAAAIGMLAGLAMYALAIGTTIIVVISLSVLRFVEGIMLRRSSQHGRFYVRFGTRERNNVKNVVDLLEEHEVDVKQLRTEEQDGEHVVHVQAVLPRGLSQNQLLALMGTLEQTVGIDSE